jgi:hypothetical protein
MADKPVKPMGPKGEGYLDENGYRRIGNVPEHRVVMAAHLGRHLTTDEHVHHINGIRHDNRLENLELWTVRRQPAGQRVEDRIADAAKTLREYAPHLLADRGVGGGVKSPAPGSGHTTGVTISLPVAKSRDLAA